MTKHAIIAEVRAAVAVKNSCEAAVLAQYLLDELEEKRLTELSDLIGVINDTIICFYGDMAFWFSPGSSLEAVFGRCVRATDSLVQLAERQGIPHTMPV